MVLANFERRVLISRLKPWPIVSSLMEAPLLSAVEVRRLIGSYGDVGSEDRRHSHRRRTAVHASTWGDSFLSYQLESVTISPSHFAQCMGPSCGCVSCPPPFDSPSENLAGFCRIPTKQAEGYRGFLPACVFLRRIVECGHPERWYHRRKRDRNSPMGQK